MNTIINEFRVLAVYQKKKLSGSQFEMRPVKNESIGRLSFLIQSRNAKVTVADDLLPSMGNAHWIDEVWYNYLSNAVKYGGNPPEIFIGSEEAEEGFIKYFIRDNDPGLSEEQLSKVYLGHPITDSLVKQGFGFGLDIFMKIIKKLDGYVQVKSTEGKGSEFSFYLKKR